jgi:hypothetical protein
MRLMKELCFAVSLKSLLIVVAGVASLVRHFALSLNHLRVTRKALHVETLHIAVIELEIGLIYHFIGNLMTERASARPFIKRLILEMAQETGRLCYGYVASLNYLRVA